MLVSDDPPALATARLTLRPLVASDADALFALHADPIAMRYWSTPPWSDVRQAHEALARDAEALAAGASYRFGLFDRDGAALVGACSLYAIDATHRRAQVGCILARTHWGRGLMQEALGAVIDFAYGSLGLRRLEADIDPRNEASARLLVRLGFAFEALMRERWIVGGEVSDSAIYGRLREARDDGSGIVRVVEE